MEDANLAAAAGLSEISSSSTTYRSFFGRVRDHFTLLAGIRFCAAFNAGGLIALLGYGALLVGLDRLGVSIVVFIPMVATFAFGLLLAGAATTAWFASRHYMAHAGLLPAPPRRPDEAPAEPAAAMSRAARFQFVTTHFVAASYLTFVAGLAGVPILMFGPSS